MIANIGLLTLLGICSYDDITKKQIRLIEIIVFGILGVLIRILKYHTDIKSILIAMTVGLIMYLISHITKEEIGKGDALIFIDVGIYLGFAKTVELLWISALIAGLVGGYYMIFKKKNKKYEMPFVPFILGGFVLLCSANILFGAPV